MSAKVFDAGAMTSTNTLYSAVVEVENGVVSFHLDWSGTPNGAFTLWYSNKPNAATASDTDWVQDTTWSPTNPAGSASKGFYTIGNLCAKYVRIKYVNASSTGTLNGWAFLTKR